MKFNEILANVSYVVMFASFALLAHHVFFWLKTGEFNSLAIGSLVQWSRPYNSWWIVTKVDDLLFNFPVWLALFMAYIAIILTAHADYEANN